MEGALVPIEQNTGSPPLDGLQEKRAEDSPTTFTNFQVFVPVGGETALANYQNQSAGRWLNCSMTVCLKTVEVFPAAGSELAEDSFDARPSGFFDAFRQTAPTQFRSFRVLTENVTFIYSPDQQIDTFVHPAAIVKDTSVAAGHGLLSFIALRFVMSSCLAPHMERFMPDSVLLFRSQSAAACFRVSSGLRRVCKLLHDPANNSQERQAIAVLDRQSKPPMLLNFARGLVSKRKNRLVVENFNLDLAYITSNLMAMGFPALSQTAESYWRNDMDDVYRYLEKHHKGKYTIYNLCTERAYPPSCFGGHFTRMPFIDHNPPPLQLMFDFCEQALSFLINARSDSSTRSKAVHQTSLSDSVDSFLSSSGLIIVHCKAGKSRTGVMVTAFLLYSAVKAAIKNFESLAESDTDPLSQDLDTPSEQKEKAFRKRYRAASSIRLRDCISLYNENRSKDGKGLTIPSQVRFLHYFERCVKELDCKLPLLRPASLSAVMFNTTPWVDIDGGCTPFVLVQIRKRNHNSRPLGRREWVGKGGHTAFPYLDGATLDSEGDIRLPQVPDEMTMVTLYDSRKNGEMKRCVADATITIPLGGVVVADEVCFLFYDSPGSHKPSTRDSPQIQGEFLCSCWLHTSFLDGSTGVVTLGRSELDGCCKGSSKELFDPKFSVSITYTPLPPEPRTGNPELDTRWLARNIDRTLPTEQPPSLRHIEIGAVRNDTAEVASRARNPSTAVSPLNSRRHSVRDRDFVV